MKKEIIDLAKYRMQEAHQSLEDSRVLIKNRSYRGAMNRVYYGIFYTAKALLALRELDSAKHSGVISLFHRGFIKPGLFSQEVGKIINDAYDLRCEGDYKDFREISQDEVEEMLNKAKIFIAEAERVLKEMIKKT